MCVCEGEYSIFICFITKVIVFVTGEDVFPLSHLGDYLEFSFVFLSIIVHLFQAGGRLPLSTSPRQNETPDALSGLHSASHHAKILIIIVAELNAE